MKKSILLLFSVAVSVSTPSFASNHKVYICHFGQNHESEGGIKDYEVLGFPSQCESQGGKVLFVACQGAKNGHVA